MKKKEYIYFIDLTEPLVCVNFIKTNQIISPILIHYKTYKTVHPILNIDPDILLTDINSIEIGFSSPRFLYIILSNWATNGLKIGIGVNNTKLYSKSDVKRIHKIAKLEVEFEKARRRIDKLLPSRLTCIFVAENNIDGKVMLKNMFSKKKAFHIAPVYIEPIQHHRADAKWIADYEKTGKISSIENYWKGIDFDNFPSHEHLIEGVVSLKYKKDRELIKKEFKRNPKI